MHNSDMEKFAAPSDSSAGHSELAFARQLRSEGNLLSHHDDRSAAVLLLKRAEVLFLLRALKATPSLSDGVFPLKEADFSESDVIGRAITGLSPKQLTALKVALGGAAELALAKAPLSERRDMAQALRRFERALLGELISTQQLDSRKRRKVAGAVTVGAVIMASLLVVGTVKFIGRWTKPNLALHKPVSLSSTLGGEHVDGQKLVNGDMGDIGFHTQFEPNPFATIDLGQSRAISEIVVHNRKDCCQERAVPLAIELSDDGSTYRVVAERREGFETWIADNIHNKGRYVRLHLNATNALHLAEVEVY